MLGQLAVVEPQLGADQLRDEVAGAGGVVGRRGVVAERERGVGRAAAEIEDGDRGRRARCGERAADRHLGLDAADLGPATPVSSCSARATCSIGPRLVRTIAASATAFSSANSPARPPRTSRGTKRVGGEHVADADRRDLVAGQVGHRLAHAGEHPADVRAGLADDVGERLDAPQRVHDLGSRRR